jgi:hypothetical protein
MSTLTQNGVELIDLREVSDIVSAEEADFINGEILPAIAEQMRYLHREDKANPATLREYFAARQRTFGEFHDFLDNVAGQYVYRSEAWAIMKVFSRDAEYSKN